MKDRILKGKCPLIILVLVLFTFTLVSVSQAMDDGTAEEVYPSDLDALEEFIQSYYKLFEKQDLAQNYPFLNHDKNLIQNDAKSLAPFYQKLIELRYGLRSRVSILHIGDSHIQSGYLPGAARSSLQKYFGNAGRGLVFPWKLAGTNQPDDIRISSNSYWNRTNAEKGICGYGLWTKQSGNLTIKTNNFFGLDNSFNKITLITKEKENSYDWTLSGNSETPNIEIAAFGKQAIYQLLWNTPTREITLQYNSANSQDIANLYGIVLENNVRGLLYHSVGFNGATFEKYGNMDDFFAQIPILKPDLIVVSLGTNDAQGRYNGDHFERNLKRFGTRLKKAAKSTPVIYTLPPDSHKGGIHNADLGKVEKQLSEYAVDNNAAWWDLGEVMGGVLSVSKWRANALAAGDNIHFTPKGYMLQGQLFYSALLKGYSAHAQRQGKR
ncbi:MAG: GDSL-type esterase/lipase family protein [Candidatus Cloacimonetes bacterium]|nr:GDSL-type esterase/lipase family protein [Candidatus Cloacimonadota bacterium]